MAKKSKKLVVPKVDGLGPKDVKNIRIALRKVWAYSHARKLCINRATREDGFAVCEQCSSVVAKVYADHITPCGQVDGGYITRMWCPSAQLQALCDKCHRIKTNRERRDVKRMQEADLDFF